MAAEGRIEAYIEPIDVLVPVLPGDGEICNVLLLGVVLGVAVRLRGACHCGAVRLGVHELGVDGVFSLDRLVGGHFGGAVALVLGLWCPRLRSQLPATQ